MKKILAGQITLGNECDISDPSYPKGLWCMHTLSDMLPGEYNCYAVTQDEKEWGERVQKAWIIHEDYDKGEHPAGTKGIHRGKSTLCCGVDSGLFGFFDDKPDFSNAWDIFDEKVGDTYPRCVIIDYDARDAFIVSTGYGDGGYDAMIWRNKDEKIVAVSIRFI